MIVIGCKGKYSEWITEDGLTVVQGWARDGLTDLQIAGKMGITTQTFYDWQRRFPSFSDAIKKGKAPVDIQVENALLKRALGYIATETIEEVYQAGQGEDKRILSSHIRKITKEVPPDVGAIVFWLKNRRPGRWRDKIEAAPDSGNELLQSLMELERRCQGD